MNRGERKREKVGLRGHREQSKGVARFLLL